MINFMTSDYVIGLELVGKNAVGAWRGLAGPTNSETAREQAPDSIRALYGIDGTKNACHGSDATASADRELNFFFNRGTGLKVLF